MRLSHSQTQQFHVLAAFNERFAKLQDTLAAAMRHSALLMGQATAPFLRVLALFVKLQVIDSVERRQVCRIARNMAAHDYKISYILIAEYFNGLHSLQPVLVDAAARLLSLCAQTLDVRPTTANFEVEFQRVCDQRMANGDLRQARYRADKCGQVGKVQIVPGIDAQTRCPRRDCRIHIGL